MMYEFHHKQCFGADTFNYLIMGLQFTPCNKRILDRGGIFSMLFYMLFDHVSYS